MVGDMFNQHLKYRVDALCNELAGLLWSQALGEAEAGRIQSQSQSSGEGVSLFVAGTGSAGAWWPAELGSPTSTGAQNDMLYACFPGRRRLAIQQGGQVRVYDTGEHTISGFSQQQGGDQSLTFTSQFGLVRVADLGLVSPRSDRFQNPSSRRFRGALTNAWMCAASQWLAPLRRLPASLATGGHRKDD